MAIKPKPVEQAVKAPAKARANPPGKNGGVRPGAGRKPTARAAVKKNSRVIAQRVLEQGPISGNWPPEDGSSPILPTTATPLDVMIEAMRRAYSLGGPIAAFPYAEKAAPYLHARIATIELKNPDDGKPFTIAFQWQGTPEPLTP